MTVEEVIREAARDVPDYRNSGGGITLSGGEPAAQPGFSVLLLKALRDAGIHSAIETSGCAPAEHFDVVARAADLVLFDLKHTDPAMHEEQTGVPNRGIVDNLKRLVRTGKPVVLLIPVVPGVNDAIGELVRLANFAKGLGDAVERIVLLPYYRCGVPKYARLGMASRCNGAEPPPPERMEEIAGLFRAYDLKARVGG
jgi:pyruvate formate lyase activating enzyme